MQLTKEQRKEVIRVCGENFEPSDIPAFWRNQDEEDRQLKGGEIEDI